MRNFQLFLFLLSKLNESEARVLRKAGGVESLGRSEPTSYLRINSSHLSQAPFVTQAPCSHLSRFFLCYAQVKFWEEKNERASKGHILYIYNVIRKSLRNGLLLNGCHFFFFGFRMDGDTPTNVTGHFPANGVPLQTSVVVSNARSAYELSGSDPFPTHIPSGRTWRAIS